MKHKLFIALVVLSVLLAAGSLCGHFGEVGSSVGYITPAGAANVTIYGLTVISAHGRLEIFTSHGTGPIPTGTRLGWNFFFQHGFSLQPPPWQAVSEFEAHALPAASVAPGFSAEIVAFPLWCLLLPSLIAPAIWLRKRFRERQEIRGFAIEPAN